MKNKDSLISMIRLLRPLSNSGKFHLSFFGGSSHIFRGAGFGKILNDDEFLDVYVYLDSVWKGLG